MGLKRLRRAIKRSRKRVKRARRGKKSAVRPRSIATAGVGFPKKMLMTHKYRERVTMVATSGALTKYQFSTNSLWDPNTSGTGHQPLYFDQMTALYDHYVVIGSRFRAKFCTDGASTVSATFTAYIDDDTTTTNIADIVTGGEQTQAYRQIQFVPAPMTRALTANLKWSAKKFFGKGVLANTDLQGSGLSGPNEQSQYTVLLQGNGTSSTTITGTLLVEIEYITVWKELKEVATS